jgi:hypothetical protein
MFESSRSLEQELREGKGKSAKATVLTHDYKQERLDFARRIVPSVCQ